MAADIGRFYFRGGIGAAGGEKNFKKKKKSVNSMRLHTDITVSGREAVLSETIGIKRYNDEQDLERIDVSRTSYASCRKEDEGASSRYERGASA